jgi:hypothetical protein
MLAMAQEKYEVFHVIVEDGNYPRHGLLASLRSKWESLLGKRAIYLDNHKNLAAVIKAVIAVNEGGDPEAAIDAAQGASVKQSIRHALRLDNLNEQSKQTAGATAY